MLTPSERSLFSKLPMRLSNHGVACYCLHQGWGSPSQKQFFYSLPSLVEIMLQTCDKPTVLTSCWCQTTTLNWWCSHPVPSDRSPSLMRAAREWTRGPALPRRWTERLGSAKGKWAFQPPYSKAKNEFSRPEALNVCHLMEKEKGLGDVQVNLKLLSSTQTLKVLKILFARNAARSVWKQCCTTCTKRLPDTHAMPSTVQRQKVLC